MKRLQKAALATAAIMSATACLNGCKQASSTASEVATDSTSQIVVAYVTGWSSCVPDPSQMTHINYAFGKVAPSFDSVTGRNPEDQQLLGHLFVARRYREFHTSHEAAPRDSRF